MRILKFFMLLLVLMIGGVKSAWAGDVKRNVTSSYLKNTSFEDATDFNYWTNDGLTIKNDNGKFSGNFAEKYGYDEVKSGSIKQKALNLPAGSYRVTAKCVGGTDNGSGYDYLYATTASGTTKADVVWIDGDAAEIRTLDFTNNTKQDVEIGFVVNNTKWWSAIDDVTLYAMDLAAAAQALPNGNVTVGTWYQFTTGSSSDAYTLSSNGDATITYTTDGTLTDDTGVSDTWTLHAKQNVLLAPNTTYYIKSSAAVTLTKTESSVTSSYVSGWTKVTSISDLQDSPENYFFAIFSANNTGVMLDVNTTENNEKPRYQTATNPLSSTAYLFEMENYKSKMVLKSVANNKYFENRSTSNTRSSIGSDGPWNFHADLAEKDDNCLITLTYTNGVYTIQTANTDTGAGNYLGLWYSGSGNKGYVDDEILAGNKAEGAKGSFLIYRIAKENCNFTSMIVNPSFESATGVSSTITGWTNSGAGSLQTQGNGSFDNHVGSYYAEIWHNSNTIDLNQPVNNLPAGQYTISAKAFSNASDIVLYAKAGDASEVTTSVTTSGTYSVVVKLTSLGNIKLGLKGTSGAETWTCVDDFQMSYKPFADSNDYAALSDVITTAETYTLGFEVGEYAPYINADALEKLAAAQAILSAKPATASEVEAATTALRNATWTANDREVNAVYNPTFALSTNNMKAIGWRANDGTVIGNESGEYHSRAMVGDSKLSPFNNTNSALYLRFDGTNSNVSTIYNYGEATGYTIPLKAAKYRVKADAGVWSGDNTQWHKDLRVAIVKKSDGTEIAGQTITTPNSSLANSSTDIISFDFYVEIPTAGDYVLTVDNMAETSTGIVISNFELTKSGVPVTVGTSGYATFSCNYKLDFTGIEDVTAWVATSKGDGYIRMTQVTGSVPAATGLVLKGTKGETTNAIIPVTTSASAPESNLLVACLTETTVSKAEEGSTNYVLSLQDGNAVFAPIDDVSATVGAG